MLACCSSENLVRSRQMEADLGAAGSSICEAQFAAVCAQDFRGDAEAYAHASFLFAEEKFSPLRYRGAGKSSASVGE